jgi:uncharacterized protein (DUF885 family)
MGDRYDGVTGVDDLFDRHWRALMEEHPETATYVGWHEFHDRFTDMSMDAIDRRRREAREPLDALHRIDRASLDDDERLSYDLFEA